MKILNKIRFKLGENISNLKTLTKRWLNELSKKSLILPQYWQPAYSYGQPLNRQMPNPFQRMNLFAGLVGQTGRNVQLRSSSNKYIEGNLLKEAEGTNNAKNYFGSVHITAVKIRVLNALYTFWSNKRLRWGMILLLIAAPLTKFIYLLFPMDGFGVYLINIGSIKVINVIEGVDNWFYVTFYHYFSVVGELLAPVILIFGIFLLFPPKYYPSYLVGVPFGYYLGMLVHRMFFVSTNEEFHSGFASTVTLAFLLLGVVMFIVSDKILFKENHRKRDTEARIIGLINMPGMKWNDKEGLIKKEVAEAMKVDNELFVKESA
ncbi:MAG: hypothetical protein ABFS32_03110 [Bacteroidota bacterium]